MGQRIHIVTGGTRGLRRDAEVLQAVLERHWPVQVQVSRERNGHALPQRLGLGLRRLLGTAPPLLLCAEILPSSWCKLGRPVLIPNQEWMRAEVERNLDLCAAVFCKTRYAQARFAERGHAARFIGFTGADLLDPAVPKDDGRFLHMAGRSDLKGTATLLRTWLRHPHWPRLTLITSHESFRSLPAADNIELLFGHLSDERLRHEANACGLHLCLSETEGSGITCPRPCPPRP